MGVLGISRQGSVICQQWPDTKTNPRSKTEPVTMMATSSGERKPVLLSLQFTGTSNQLAVFGSVSKPRVR